MVKKLGEAVAALLSQRNLEEVAIAIGIGAAALFSAGSRPYPCSVLKDLFAAGFEETE